MTISAGGSLPPGHRDPVRRTMTAQWTRETRIPRRAGTRRRSLPSSRIQKRGIDAESVEVRQGQGQ